MSFFLRPMFAITLLFGSQCGDEPESPPSDLDPDVPPVTSGNWYRPPADITWQWQLQGTPNTTYDVDLYDLDLFDTPTNTIRTLQNQGRAVLCYFSAGSAENWRPDFETFEDSDMGNPMIGWAGEWWVDVRSANVVEIMEARLDLAVEKGCDGVEPDNVDGYTNGTGFPLTSSDQLAFNRHLANAAHERGLAVALKNDLGQVGQLLAYYDLALNEECHVYEECWALEPFVAAGKPVLNAEYTETKNEAQAQSVTLCQQAQEEGLRTLILPLDLDDAFRVSCD